MEELSFALDTFYAVMSGALVMFMAAGFTMLEAGLVQKKDVSEIVTKNIGLYSICLLYTSPSPRDQRGSRMPSSA